MARHHPIGLASGVCAGASAQDTVRAAIAAGFDSVGLWVEPAHWTDATTREVRQIAKDGGISIVDCEVAWQLPGPLDPEHLKLVDIARELGAANVLITGRDPDPAALAEKMQQLCEHSGSSGPRIALEFMRFTDVRNIAQAIDVVSRVEHPAKAILIDTLHVFRTGNSAADFSEIPREWITYAQICDAPATGPDLADNDALLAEARDGRLQCGEGDLPLADMIRALPDDLPLSVELRSRPLRKGWPDIVERAKITAEKTRRFLAGL